MKSIEVYCRSLTGVEEFKQSQGHKGLIMNKFSIHFKLVKQ